MKLSPWLMAVILVVGCGGMEGPPGPAGPQGPQGDPGIGLTKSTYCTGRFSGQSPLNLEYAAYLFADGSVMASCSVWGPSLEARGVNLWKSTQAGAAVGGCLVSADADSGSYGYWNFRLTSSTTATASYSDPGSTYDGRSATLTCVIN